MACHVDHNDLGHLWRGLFCPIHGNKQHTSVNITTTSYVATRNNINMYMPFLKDLQALVKWTSKF